MASTVSYRVKGVPGYHVIDAVSLQFVHRIVGHTKTQTGTTRIFGKKDPQPVFEYSVNSAPDVVAETRDGHIRSAIEGGALDYVETILTDSKGKQSTQRDPALVAVTTANMLKRATRAAAAAKNAAALGGVDAAKLAEADAERAKVEAAIAAMSGTPTPAPTPAPVVAPIAEPTPAVDASTES